MRQSNQKSRSRGRGRKQQNPMSKNFESNGPDVKIRGNASHIAEKYSSLARDAQSNGDSVMAENYYQHAEHYNRIVAIAQQQNQQRAEEAAANANGKSAQPEVEGDTSENQANGNGQTTEAAASENANAEENVASNGETKPKRNGRGRGKPKSDIVASEEDAKETETAAENKETEEAVAAEVMSDDAAKLPGSIIGEATTEEA